MSSTARSLDSARWVEAFQMQLRRGRHVILHGNVFDFAMFRGQFLPFLDAVEQALRECGYESVARYNIIDQLTYRSAQERGGAVGQSRSGYSVPGAGAKSGQPGGATAPERSSHSSSVGGRPDQAGAGAAPEAASERRTTVPFESPEDAMVAIRSQLTERTDQLVSVIVDYSDRMFGPEGASAEPDRRVTTLLSLTATEVTPRPSDGMSNAMVLVTPTLGRLPASLYREHPALCVVDVPRPDADERRCYLATRFTAFYGSTATAVEAVEEEFVALTDGFAYRDLEALAAASFDHRIGIGECRRLVQRFKYGEVKDPWEALSREKLERSKDFLSGRVFGQEAAIDAVQRVLYNARGGVQVEGAAYGSTRPKGVLFFVGPTGVGKTELVKALAELVFEETNAYVRFDMSEYGESHAAERLAGAPPGYVGYEEGGQLTSWIKRRPFSVVLFDEIEKAHRSVLDKFLQILDEGRLTDGRGETVYFSHALIVFTSNIGSVVRHGKVTVPVDLSQLDTYADVDQHYREAVANFFRGIGRPEILGRIGRENIIAFDRLRSMDAILRKFLSGMQTSAREKHGAEVTYDESLLAAGRLDCEQPENLLLGGRAARDYVQQKVLPLVNRAVLSGAKRIRLSAESGVVKVESHG